MTGAIDMDLIQTGVSASERVARARLAQEIKALLLGARRSPGSALCDLANADPCLAWTAGQSLQSSGSTICILSGRIGRGRFSMRGFWGCAPD